MEQIWHHRTLCVFLLRAYFDRIFKFQVDVFFFRDVVKHQAPLSQTYMELDIQTREMDSVYKEPHSGPHHNASNKQDVDNSPKVQEYIELNEKTRDKESVYQELAMSVYADVHKEDMDSPIKNSEIYMELDEKTRLKESAYEEPLNVETERDEKIEPKSSKYEEFIQIGKPIKSTKNFNNSKNTVN